MEEKIKKICLVGLLMVALLSGLSIAYYYAIFLPSHQEKIHLSSMKERCREVGEEIDQQRKENPLYSATLIEPEYTYNKKLNTCLYYAEFRFGPNPPYESYIGIVKDALSNKIIMQFHARIDKDDTLLSCDGCIDKEDFYSKKAELFNQ